MIALALAFQVIATVAAACPDTTVLGTVKLGASAQFGFGAQLRNLDSTLVWPQPKPQWAVKPVTLGTVDSTGRYVAKRAGTVVVQGRVRNQTLLWCLRNVRP